MPSLPSKTARRKHVTPIANLHENDVWQRTFKLLGLQPLTPFLDVAPDADNLSRTSEMATATDIEAPPADTLEPKKPKITILDLPAETQKDIFKHVCTVISSSLRLRPGVACVGLNLMNLADSKTPNVGIFHGSHCAFSCIETLQGHSCGATLSKFPHSLPRRRRSFLRISHRWTGRRTGHACHERL